MDEINEQTLGVIIIQSDTNVSDDFPSIYPLLGYKLWPSALPEHLVAILASFVIILQYILKDCYYLDNTYNCYL